MLPENRTQIERLIDELDLDRNGKINYNGKCDTFIQIEFMAATLDQNTYTDKKTLSATFQAFDRNNSGNINREELLEILCGEDVSQERKELVMGIIDEADKDGDGKLNYDEFETAMKENSL